MNIYFLILLMVFTGFALGMLYFLGLMKTMKFIATMKNWQVIMVLSFILRAGLLVGAFFLLAGTDWKRIAALVLGFMFARLVMVHRVKKTIPLIGKTGAA